MRRVQAGDVVTIRFRGRLADGTVFGSSAGREPIRFTADGRDMIPGLSAAVLGMRVGERRTVAVAPEEGFGPRWPALLQRVPRAVLPPQARVGDLVIGRDGGAIARVWVRSLGDGFAVIDGNHPLAGEALEFDIKLLAVRRGRHPRSHGTQRDEAMPEEVVNGRAPGQTKPAGGADLTALIRAQVIRRLGEPEQLLKVQVRPLWDNRYRVNVLVGPDAASARVAHGYFVTVDPAGAIVASHPEIRRRYAGAGSADDAGPGETPPAAPPP
jgi:peptidylprolyl isomerase